MSAPRCDAEVERKGKNPRIERCRSESVTVLSLAAHEYTEQSTGPGRFCLCRVHLDRVRRMLGLCVLTSPGVLRSATEDERRLDRVCR